MTHLQVVHGFLHVPVVVLQGCLALLYCHTMNSLLHLRHVTKDQNKPHVHRLPSSVSF